MRNAVHNYNVFPRSVLKKDAQLSARCQYIAYLDYSYKPTSIYLKSRQFVLRNVYVYHVSSGGDSARFNSAVRGSNIRWTIDNSVRGLVYPVFLEKPRYNNTDYISPVSFRVCLVQYTIIISNF